MAVSAHQVDEVGRHAIAQRGVVLLPIPQLAVVHDALANVAVLSILCAQRRVRWRDTRGRQHRTVTLCMLGGRFVEYAGPAEHCSATSPTVSHFASTGSCPCCDRRRNSKYSASAASQAR